MRAERFLSKPATRSSSSLVRRISSRTAGRKISCSTSSRTTRPERPATIPTAGNGWFARLKEESSAPKAWITSTVKSNAAQAEASERVRDGDLGRGRSLHDRLGELNEAAFFDTNTPPIKYMMKKLGLLANNEHRLPMVPATLE